MHGINVIYMFICKIEYECIGCGLYKIDEIKGIHHIHISIKRNIHTYTNCPYMINTRVIIKDRTLLTLTQIMDLATLLMTNEPQRDIPIPPTSEVFSYLHFKQDAMPKQIITSANTLPYSRTVFAAVCPHRMVDVFSAMEFHRVHLTPISAAICLT